MKKQYPLFAGISAIIIGLAAISAQAQASKVKVPFDFTVNGRTLPAGVYRLDRLAGRPVVAIRPIASTGSGVFSTFIDANQADGVEQWTFHRYGNKYFLESVETLGYRMDIPNSRQERSLLVRNNVGKSVASRIGPSPAESVAIMASSK